MDKILECKTHTIQKQGDKELLIKCNTQKIRDELFQQFDKVNKIAKFLR